MVFHRRGDTERKHAATLAPYNTCYPGIQGDLSRLRFPVHYNANCWAHPLHILCPLAGDTDIAEIATASAYTSRIGFVTPETFCVVSYPVVLEQHYVMLHPQALSDSSRHTQVATIVLQLSCLDCCYRGFHVDFHRHSAVRLRLDVTECCVCARLSIKPSSGHRTNLVPPS